MRRRSFLLALTAALAIGPAAYASDLSDDVVRRLKKGGYRIISVDRTFLGRVRIRAAKGNGEREIVLNPVTGEILRDLWVSGGPDSDSYDDGGSDNGGGSTDNGGSDDGGGEDSGKDGSKDRSDDSGKDDGDNSGKGGDGGEKG
ncbi:MAG: hypothetical protein WBP18_07425 [Paracoccaceae bacterium]